MNHARISSEECKGCRLCVEACPNDCLVIGSAINKMGYYHAKFQVEKCTACGICYYVCPEPGAITVIQDKEGSQ
ncbi:MAG: 4Fe-4S binding protein [Chitinivibrionales bacterium]|nr:4Fe-4S binding protein [Chitinivibrionales bacterium]